MYAQVVNMRFQPGKVDEAVAIFRDVVLDGVRQQHGFTDGYLLVDRDTDSAVAFSLWETEADVEAVVTTGFFLQQAARLAGVLAEPGRRTVYEVAARA